MNEQNLFSVHLRYQRCLTDSRKSRSEGFSNLLKKAVITEPFQTLSGDITYIPTDEGFEYTYTKTGMFLAGKTAARMKRVWSSLPCLLYKRAGSCLSESFSIRIVAVSTHPKKECEWFQRWEWDKASLGSECLVITPGVKVSTRLGRKNWYFSLVAFLLEKGLGKVCFSTLKASITQAGARNVLVIPVLINVCKTGLWTSNYWTA